MSNGGEFANHINYQLKGFKTYFCNAYSPWQKGLVEKINSMIHRIFPKDKDITKLTSKKLQKIEKVIPKIKLNKTYINYPIFMI